ncbi:metallophosphoesterase [Priestia megaterium]|uniref:metallophosphoesterase n=1 Tax=Priestia megaterium TaxID=1404 RepID=UPI000BFD3BF5|nr:metallophosphoesterase [Priestia megaterium]PGQ88216.1 hypothetical protein COA18_04635 [Priestia megaterium]
MIKLLHSTDWHFTGKNPAARTDDYPATIERKIKDFFQTGHELEVDAFLGGGDFFNSAYTSPEIVTRLGKIVEAGKKDKKMFGIWGNHDEIGYNPNTVKKTSIGVMQEFSKDFIILDRTPYIFEANGMKVKLTGVSAYPQMDSHIYDEHGNIVQHRARDWIVEHTDGTPHVHMAHGFLTSRPLLDTIRHTLIEEMRHTKATITLGAHDHNGFPVTKLDHGYAYNPGSLGRTKASHEEMNRMPKYALVTIHDDGTGEIQPIPCKVAEPGIEVMDRSVIEEKKAKEAKLKAARENMRSVLKDINIKGVDLKVVVDSYEDKTRPAVFAELKKRLHFI